MARRARPTSMTEDQKAQLFEDQMSRALSVFNFRADYMLCEQYGLKGACASGWRARKHIPPPLLIDIARDTGVSLDWLVFGDRSCNNNKQKNNESIGDILGRIGDSDIPFEEKIALKTVATKLDSLPETHRKIFSLLGINQSSSETINIKEVDDFIAMTKKIFSQDEIEILINQYDIVASSHDIENDIEGVRAYAELFGARNINEAIKIATYVKSRL